MRQFLLSFLTVVLFAFLLTAPVLAAGLEVDNIAISVQAADAVQAKDQAINQAQRKAFGALVGKSDADIARISDTQIARLVKGFSVQGERLTSRSYRANFTIRFLQAPTNNFIIGNGLQFTEAAANGQPIAFDNTVAAAVPPAGTPAQPGAAPVAATAPAAATQSIVVLPILDIGSRRVIWDDSNPWRDAWRDTDRSTPNIKVSIPLGDIDDVTDIKDASFLSDGKANIANMLQRYAAGNLYVVVAKNMGAALDTTGGMSISLYRHDGQNLKFIRKMIIHPRAGYLFNDAVPAAMQMIVSANGGKDSSTTTVNNDVLDTQPSDDTPATAPAPVVSQKISGALMITVPYQTLQQWVSIQKRLRMVPGIQSIIPVRVSASSAQVRVTTSTTTTDDLSRNLTMQQFILQKMPNGEMVLTEQ